MRNFIFALAGLVIVISVVFLLAKGSNKNDTFIPSQKGLESSSSVIISKPEGTEGAKINNLPFKVLSAEEIKGKKIRILTDEGDIVFAFSADSPIAASNFIYLAKKNFYDGLTFHRVIKGFMVQGGDPKGNGTGDPGYKFADELNSETASYKQGYVRGTVAMANSGPNTNGSQFFIMHQDYQLPRNYTIFGHVISGIDVVDMIANTQTDSNDKPVKPIIMKKVSVE